MLGSGHAFRQLALTLRVSHEVLEDVPATACHTVN